MATEDIVAAPVGSAVAPNESARDGLPRRAYLDVSGLPDLVFGQRDLMWWGTMGFVLIEGMTLALCLVVYLYLWKNFDQWPPAGTEQPTLLIPSIQLAVMLLSLPMVQWLSRAARRFEFARVRVGLIVATLWMAVITALRALELLRALHVRWDTNAYGSAQWLVVGSHATLIAIELVEIAGMAVLFWSGRAEQKHYSDVSDVAMYWAFLVVAWLPVYVLCFLGPRYLM